MTVAAATSRIGLIPANAGGIKSESAKPRLATNASWTDWVVAHVYGNHCLGFL